MDSLMQLEIAITLFFQSLGTWLVAPMKLITMLGNEEFFILILPVLYWCIDSALGLRVAVIFLLSGSFNDYLKMSFFSPRPYWVDPQVKAYVSETSFGLPSGHSQNSAAVWGVIGSAYRKPWVRWAVILVIFLVGLSRIVLGAHFTRDVLVGWLLGGLLLWALLRLEKPFMAWLKPIRLPARIGLALASSLILMAITFIIIQVQSPHAIPAEWQQNALAAAPEKPISPFNPSGIMTLSGVWFGLLAGIAWFNDRYGKFNARGTPVQLVLRYALGLAGVVVLWYGLGSIFPRTLDFTGLSLRWLRYVLVGGWVSALAPWLFVKFKIAPLPSAVNHLRKRHS